MHPYSQIYRTFVAPGWAGCATGLTALALTVTALALGASFLNAAFGLCLSCEIYLRLPAPLRSRGGISADPGEKNQ